MDDWGIFQLFPVRNAERHFKAVTRSRQVRSDKFKFEQRLAQANAAERPNMAYLYGQKD